MGTVGEDDPDPSILRQQSLTLEVLEEYCRWQGLRFTIKEARIELPYAGFMVQLMVATEPSRRLLLVTGMRRPFDDASTEELPAVCARWNQQWAGVQAAVGDVSGHRSIIGRAIVPAPAGLSSLQIHGIYSWFVGVSQALAAFVDESLPLA